MEQDNTVSAQLLVRPGMVRCVDGVSAVVFDLDRCPGCDGRCGVSIGLGSAMALDVALPAQTRVEVVTPAGVVLGLALLVLGVPLVLAVAAAVVAEMLAWGEWTVAAALAGSALTVVGALALAARRGDAGARTAPVVEDPHAGLVRIRLG